MFNYNGQDITHRAWQNEDGRIFSEGWYEGLTQEQIDELGVTGFYEPKPKTADELLNEVKQALQTEIDAKAKALGFSNGNSLMLYAGFTNPFKTLAVKFATWEATVWAEAEAYKLEVLAGKKPMVSADEAVSMMPEYQSA